MKIINQIIEEDCTLSGFCDESGEMIDLTAIGDHKERYYSSSSLQPLAMTLDRLGIKYRILAQNMAIRVGKVKFISLEKWRIRDFSIENLQKLESRFGGGELPTGIGFAVARYLPLDWAKDKILKREAVLMTEVYEDEYFSAYKAGIISNMTDSGKLIHNIQSWDISSAYPAALLEGIYPTTNSKEENVAGLDLKSNGMISGIKGYIGRFTLTLTRKENVALSPMQQDDQERGFYSEDSTFDKVGLIQGTVEVAASMPEMLAIAMTHNIENYTIHEVYSHNLGTIGGEFKELILKYYENKKIDEADKIFINTMTGMMGRSPIKGIRGDITDETIDKAITRYNDDKFPMIMGTARKMDQRWAAYMNSWTRFKMIKTAMMLQEAGAQVIYADTDSIKSVGDAEKIQEVFMKLNSTIMEKTGDSGIGKWGDESAEYEGGARFYGKRFYIKADENGYITPVLAGFDTEASAWLLNKHDIERYEGRAPAARSRWYIGRDNGGLPIRRLQLIELR